MSSFAITCDSSIDVDNKILNDNKISFIHFEIESESVLYTDDLSKEIKDQFYKQMNEGKAFKTSQINVNKYIDFFSKVYKENKASIIHISLCEGLSNSINNARQAAIALKEQGINVSIVDSTVASLGSYLVLKEAVKLRDASMGFEESVRYLYKIASLINTYYTTDNLSYFAKGGRISRTAAIFGTTLHINVVLKCGPTGKLIIDSKCHGNKKAYQTIIEKIKQTVVDPEEQTLYVCHANNETAMKQLAEDILKEVPFKNYEMHLMGSTIASHTGPGLLSVFYFGKSKN